MFFRGRFSATAKRARSLRGLEMVDSSLYRARHAHVRTFTPLQVWACRAVQASVPRGHHVFWYQYLSIRPRTLPFPSLPFPSLPFPSPGADSAWHKTVTTHTQTPGGTGGRRKTLEDTRDGRNDTLPGIRAYAGICTDLVTALLLFGMSSLDLVLRPGPCNLFMFRRPPLSPLLRFSCPQRLTSFHWSAGQRGKWQQRQHTHTHTHTAPA